jgi:Ca-activated chloride channel homolog
MPSFAQPTILLFLILVPPLLWLWRRRGPTTLRFSAIGLMAGLPRGRSVRALWGGLLLRGLGLGFLILALAGPRWPDAGTRLPAEGIAIAMVVDVSASMSERDFSWRGEFMTRLEGVKKVFRLFVDGGEGPGGEKLEARPNDLLSLVVFATRPETACPLTLDHAALLKILDAEQPRILATEATTNPGDALAWALVGLQKAPTRRKILVFLTDGESNVPPPALTPRQAAQLAGNLSIPIYAIGAGPEFDKMPKEGKDANNLALARKSLEEIAHISNGRYFPAANGQALTEACAHIDQLERTLVPSFQYRRYHEGFMWFALMGLLSWLAVLGLESTRWRRVP